VTGTSDPDPGCPTSCNGVSIYACTPGSCVVPPPGGSDRLISVPVCPNKSNGNYTAHLTEALVAGEIIFAYDTCTGRNGSFELVPGPPAAPAMSSGMIAALVGMLGLIGLFGLLRLRRDL
jgi:hypothetical protein